MNIRILLAATCSLCYASMLKAQVDVAAPLHDPIHELVIGDHPDPEAAEMPFEDDRRFSEHAVAWMVNDNEFVKSRIGLDSIEASQDLFKAQEYPLVIRNINASGDSIVVLAPPSSASPLVINGFKYTSLSHATVSGKPRMLTIPEICREYSDAPMSKTIVSLNGITLLKDIASYKIAERYILRVDVVPSSDIENCDGDFTIIKIYTKTAINRKRNVLRLR